MQQVRLCEGRMTESAMQRISVLTTIIFAAAAFSACGSPTKTKSEPAPVAECSAGDTKPADDGCNSCTCDENGNWGCTEMGCGDS